MTGPFMPFGEAADSGQVIPGEARCGGAVFRIAPEGGEPELVAWGFRNPFGLAFSPEGRSTPPTTATTSAAAVPFLARATTSGPSSQAPGTGGPTSRAVSP